MLEILILAIIAVLVVLALRSIRKQRKKRRLRVRMRRVFRLFGTYRLPEDQMTQNPPAGYGKTARQGDFFQWASCD